MKTVTRPAVKTPDRDTLWLQWLTAFDAVIPGLKAFTLTGALPEPVT